MSNFIFGFMVKDFKEFKDFSFSPSLFKSKSDQIKPKETQNTEINVSLKLLTPGNSLCWSPQKSVYAYVCVFHTDVARKQSGS